MIRILLADDHDVVRRGLRQLLESREHWHICGEASAGQAAVQLASDLTPDIAIVDLSMPELNGLEVTRRIRKQSPLTEILVYTMHGTDRHVREAFAAGARGYVLKSDPVALVEAAVEALSKHYPYFTLGIAEKILEGVHQGEAEGWADESATMMTAREREILQMLAEGQSNKQIAQMLAISGKTVESHRSAIMRKHQFESLADLTLYAIRCGLVEP